jgi:hypothetical protein
MGGSGLESVAPGSSNWASVAREALAVEQEPLSRHLAAGACGQ